MICNCPPDAAISTIPVDECLERLGQIQKFGIQRLKNGSVLNEIVIATTNPNVLGTWTDLKSATDSTKVQFSPYIENVENEVGEPRTFGGGNQTIGGIEKIVGRNPSNLTGAFYDLKQAIVKELKKYECEKELAVFLITENGLIVGITDNPATPTKFSGIPIRSFFVSDKKLGGLEESDANNFQWSFLPNWSDNLHIVTPADFNALSAL